MEINWEKKTEEKFKQMRAKVPGPMQGFAQRQVTKKAEELVSKDGRNEITEKDMIDAFFEATPFGFHGPMKTDMEALDIDYTQYGHER